MHSQRAVPQTLVVEKSPEVGMQPNLLMSTTHDFRQTSGRSLLDRWNPLHQWLEARRGIECEGYYKITETTIGPTVVARDRGGRKYEGINFASQDYLNLSSHPDVILAAQTAPLLSGVHSAGSAALMGTTAETRALEAELASFLQVQDCTVFPTGWAAGYGVVKMLVREMDHILIDMLSHACLQEGARDACKNVHQFRHCSTESLQSKLQRVRIENPDAGLLVITEGLFSMDSDTPDLIAIQKLCKEFDATLLVDVAHDLGSIGPSGLGHLGLMGLHGQIDIVMGSFSKTFASNGGFVASNHPALKLALISSCGPLTFTNSISPIAVNIVRRALSIACSEEGENLRRQLMSNAIRLRDGLTSAGFSVLGQPSAIVPVLLGSLEMSRVMTKHALKLGAIVNLVEYPAVSKNASRWRLQAMAHHTHEQIDSFVEIACTSRELAYLEIASQKANVSGDY